MMSECYEEVPIINPFGGIIRVAKSCNNCRFRKNVLVKSGTYPEYIEICLLIDDVKQNELYQNFYGYYEPPGIDGKECPFHKQISRNKKLKNLLP